MLHVQESRPHPELRRFIRAYVQRQSNPSDPALVEPVVARLGVILDFQFGDPYNVPFYGSDKANLSAPVAVIGPITARKARIIIQGRVQTLAVLFQPLGFHALFRIPNPELADIGTDAHAVIGPAASRLGQELGALSAFSERTDILDHFFLRQLQKWRPDAVVEALRTMIEPQPMRVRDAARLATLSTRQFERRSLEYAGVTPKMLTRIARFQRALQMKYEGSASWTEVAYEAQYHDQMHMIRDFRAFSSESPAHALNRIAQFHLVTVNPPSVRIATLRSVSSGTD